MILKLGMKHQAMELYKVYINRDPWMTLTYFASEWGKLLKCHLKGKTCSKLANGLKFYVFKKKLTSGIALTRCPEVIYMYITILVKQVYWYISWVSGERLQDHWSSGINSSAHMTKMAEMPINGKNPWNQSF